MSKTSPKYTESSGNVFEDLGFADSDERLAKAKLAMRIEEIITKKGMKQTEAAKVLGINQPKVSALMNGQLSGFSMGRLLHFLNLLNQDVEIVIKSRRRSTAKQGRLTVGFA